MNTFTYSALITLVFLAGIFVFTYFETPRKTFRKGIKKLSNIQILNLNRTDKTITIPARNNNPSTNTEEQDLNVYVHEY